MGNDFGWGYAVWLDGSVTDEVKTNDHWWGYNWGNTNGVIHLNDWVNAGIHTITVIGGEGCCDGGMDVKFNGF
jgi:hypothetical protein